MKYKSKYLAGEAVQVKAFMEKNKKIPRSSTLADGSTVSPYSIAYLFSKYILGLNAAEVNLVNVRIYDGVKLVDTIDEKILRDDYLAMIKNFVKFTENYHRVPRFITSQKSSTKVSFELYLYAISKIIVYYKEKGTLPNYCLFNKSYVPANESNSKTSKKNNTLSTSDKKKVTNCSNPYKSLGHPTKNGCNQMGQNTSYYCGVSALHKILRKFGITKYTQKQLAAYAGTTTKGTDHKGLETAVAKVSKDTGIKLTCKWYNFSDLGWEKLGKIICNPNADALVHLYYRLEYGHYEVINEIDVNKKQLKVINSLGSRCKDGCYCGYVEQRSFGLEKQYILGISQKSILIVKKG